MPAASCKINFRVLRNEVHENFQDSTPRNELQKYIQMVI